MRINTIGAALPDVSLHLEIAVLGAEMHIGSQHHLHIGLFHGLERSWNAVQIVGLRKLELLLQTELRLLP